MKKFKFYQDIKVTIWRRQHFTIEAENLEDAKAKAVQFQDSDVADSDTFQYDELLYDTEELMTAEENEGCATIEVYAKGEERPITTNAFEDIKCKYAQYDEYKTAHQVAYRDMAGYTAECTEHHNGIFYQAFHQNDKLVIVALMKEDKAGRYTFNESWDELVNQNERFRKTMAEHLLNNSRQADINQEVHDWLTGHLTEMVASSDAVDNAVPFTLHDIIKVWGQYTHIYQYQPAKLIGYQIVGDDDELSGELFSFQVIKNRKEAIRILDKTNVEEPHKTGMNIYPVYEGEIKEPSFII